MVAKGNAAISNNKDRCWSELCMCASSCAFAPGRATQIRSLCTYCLQIKLMAKNKYDSPRCVGHRASSCSFLMVYK